MENLKDLLMPSLVTVAALFILFVLREIGFKLVHRWAEKTKTTVDDIILSSLKTPSVFWTIALALYLGVAFSKVSEKYTNYINKIIYVALVLSITIVFARLSGRLFRFYVERAKSPVPATGLANATIKGAILITGILLIM
ncbi:MAG: mechanosensitive ion channel family protein, partial [Nitrospirae bacterium]